MKRFFYDLETCGLNPRKHSIHQISAIVEIDGKVVETLNLRVAPHPKSLLDPAALATCHVTEEQIKAYPDAAVQFGRLRATLAKWVNPHDKTDKFHRCGFNNAKFDDEFLRVFFDLQKDGSYFSFFWADSLDTMVLASQYLSPIRHTMPSFKLHRVAKTLGIDVEAARLHDALYDVELTRAIFHALPLQTITTYTDEL